MRRRAKQGEAYAFLVAHVSYKGAECVNWPFALNQGYGVVGVGKRTSNAHRVMCKLAHGEAPFKRADAAHECNNRSCINPNHLRWDTRAGNLADMIAAGTAPRGENHGLALLTEDQVKQIWKDTRPSVEIANDYGTSDGTIRAIRQGRSWSWLTGGRSGLRRAQLTEAEVLAIYNDKRPLKTIAAEYGMGIGAICAIRTGRTWAYVTGHRRAA